jgi:hypothetical protein
VSRANIPAGVVQFDPHLSLSPEDCRGLTIREHFAAMAMQGIAAYYGAAQFKPEHLAEWAVTRADALIAELSKGDQK